MTADFAAANRAIQELYDHIGERTRTLRTRLNLRQEELGRQVGLSRSAIANVEVGRQRPPLHTLIAIAQALGITLPELLGDAPLPMMATPLPQGTHPVVPAVVCARSSLRQVLVDLDKLKLVLDEVDTNSGQQ